MSAEKKVGKSASRRSRPLKPLFGTLGVRVRFLVVMTTCSLAVVALYGSWEMWQGYRSDALAANQRYAATATGGAAAIAGNVRQVLTRLGDTAVVSGAGGTDCERLVVEASFAGDFTDIGLATPSGTVICDAKIEPKTVSIGNKDFHRRAVSSGLYATGGLAETDAGREIGFAYPGKGANGAVAVVAFATMRPDAFAAGLHPTDGYVVGVADPKGESVAKTKGDDEATADAVSPAPELVSEMLASKDGVIEVLDADGVARTYSFHTAPGPTSGRLYFYAGTATERLFAEADRAKWRAGIVGGLLAGLILWLMLTLGDILIARRARRLAHVMLDVVDGETTADSLPGGLGELSGITELFSRLARELEATKKTTEEKIRSRTSILEYSKGITELEKARTDALLASISYGVVATDAEGKVSFFNDRAKNAMLWNPDKAIGIPIHSVFQLEDEKENVIAQQDWPTQRTLEQGETVVTPAPTKPLYIRLKDKSRFPVKMTISPVTLNEQTAGAMVIFRNITDEVEFDRRKSEFISIASHQLRSPMAAMKWMTHMLRGGDFGALNPKQQEWADKLYKTALAMVDLVNELLNISRLETGVKLAPRENDTAAFIDEVLTKNEPMLLEKKQQYDFKRLALPRLVFDPLMIGEVLKNLISNASKYSPEGGRVILKIETTDREVKFAVKDQGLGIPKADQKRLFSKFFRAANVLKNQIQGTGLGLYYCKSAVEVHGGEIGFESEEGKGSTFWFTLPVKSPLPPIKDEEPAAPAK